MKRIILTVLCALLVTGCVDRITTADLTAGMTRQEVVQLMGKPASTTMLNGEQQLIYQVQDQAFDREKNFYSIGFKNDRLTNIILLPEDQQEMGLIDRALRSRRLRSNNGGSYIQTPNAYGPGIHMDQYGRPVQVVPQ